MKQFLINLPLFNIKIIKINFHKILSEDLTYVIKLYYQQVDYDENKWR